jgi:hypothetical protein
MSTPKGMRCSPRDLKSGDKLHLYSDPGQIVLQLRRQIATENEVLGTSFKVSTKLTPLEAVALATELFTLASPRLVSDTKSLKNGQAKA